MEEHPEKVELQDTTGHEDYAKFFTVYDDGEVSDESFDPKHINEVLENDYFKEHLYINKELNCCIRDSARNEYTLVDGKCILSHKFVSFEKGYVIVDSK